MSQEGLDAIYEEQPSHTTSTELKNVEDVKVSKPEPVECDKSCSCKNQNNLDQRVTNEEVNKMLTEKENTLRAEFEVTLEKEITVLKSKFDFILHNEQVRTSNMLREAHRERQEKIRALQTQLECKNLAGLIYVMCSERRKSKMERLRLVEEYTNYIYALQDILTDAQTTILNLSRGYKTTARVDQEWRQKMIKILNEFQNYIINFTGGTITTTQYLWDLPELLSTESPLEVNPSEDPCQDEETEVEEEPEFEPEAVRPPWWDRLEDEDRPFVMFGDMADFKPPERRKVLKALKVEKTAPTKWKEYMFNDMFLQSNCANLDSIKNVYPHSSRYPSPRRSSSKYSHMQIQTLDTPTQNGQTIYPASERNMSLTGDTRGGDMGSLLKIMATAPNTTAPPGRPTLLGARDSIEIVISTSKLQKQKDSRSEIKLSKLNVAHRHASDQLLELNELKEEDFFTPQDDDKSASMPAAIAVPIPDEPEDTTALREHHHDSLPLLATKQHEPSDEDKINYEKICPMEKCRRLQVDSFMRSLPEYMRASPYLHYECTYDDYKACSPEQLEALTKRIDKKRRKDKSYAHLMEDDPTLEWNVVEGVATQTSELDLELPPCTCLVPNVTPATSEGIIFNVAELYPVKRALDQIKKECFEDSLIQFDRFKVVGEDNKYHQEDEEKKKESHSERLQSIKKVLRQHPSLCELFQANTRC